MQTDADMQPQPSDRPQQEAHEEEANLEENADGPDEPVEEGLKKAAFRAVWNHLTQGVRPMDDNTVTSAQYKALRAKGHGVAAFINKSICHGSG